MLLMQAPAVAYVLSYAGTAANYSVVRGGKSERVAPFFPLQSGDRITIAGRTDSAGHALQIVLAIGGERQTVAAENSPFCIGPKTAGCAGNAQLSAGANPVATVFKNILASIAPIFGEAHDDYYSAQQDAMTGHRGSEPPEIPMLPGAPLARVGAADSLTFAWQGGTAPFRVEVLQRGRIIAEKPAAENFVTLSGLRRIRNGIFALRVVDAQRQVAGGAFEVVPPASLPSKPVASLSGAASALGSNAAVVNAALLARQGRQWYLAAYQMIANVPDDPDHQAVKLRDWLSEGQPPPNP